MANSVKLLDCTLRDGGYVNNWNFGNGAMCCIFDRLNEAGVDIVEIGFLDERYEADINRSIQPNTESLMKAYAKIMPKKSQVVAMIDYGTCSIENIQPCEDTFLDGIRVIFKKEKMYDAADFGKQLIALGYDVFLQLVSVTDYSEQDIMDFSNYVNAIHPRAVSIVDTYGLMHKEQVYNYFKLLDKYLDPEIGIGYHSHNNFQLGYSNTIELLHLDTNRDIILDGTLYGMGKSAGNAPLELISMHLNEYYGKNYDLNQILEAIDTNIMPIYAEHYWGYSLFFYIAAKNDCHPNYVKYLLDKHTLSIKDVNVILDRIEPELKLRYKESIIERLYLDYLIDSINDVSCVDALNAELSETSVLLIGPGTTVTTEHEKIREYIAENKPVVVSINYIPSKIKPDYIFISNPKRYTLLTPALIDLETKVIATSNITPAGKAFDYTVRYDCLISENNEIWDNALVIILNLLAKLKVKDIALAGFDGFKENKDENYADSSFILARDYSYLSAVNECLTKKISKYKESFDIKFLTSSLYEVR